MSWNLGPWDLKQSKQLKEHRHLVTTGPDDGVQSGSSHREQLEVELLEVSSPPEGDSCFSPSRLLKCEDKWFLSLRSLDFKRSLKCWVLYVSSLFSRLAKNWNLKQFTGQRWVDQTRVWVSPGANNLQNLIQAFLFHIPVQSIRCWTWNE
jgi:hypothetical protein